MDYKEKYLKYKTKYWNMKKGQRGGAEDDVLCNFDETTNIYCRQNENIYFCKNKDHKQVPPKKYNIYQSSTKLNNMKKIKMTKIDKEKVNVCGEIKRVLLIGGDIKNKDDPYTHLAYELANISDYNNDTLYRIDILDDQTQGLPNETIYKDIMNRKKPIFKYEMHYDMKLTDDNMNMNKISNNIYDYIMPDYSVLKFIGSLKVDTIMALVSKLRVGGKIIFNSKEMKFNKHTKAIPANLDETQRQNHIDHFKKYGTKHIILSQDEIIYNDADNQFTDDEHYKYYNNVVKLPLDAIIDINIGILNANASNSEIPYKTFKQIKNDCAIYEEKKEEINECTLWGIERTR